MHGRYLLEAKERLKIRDIDSKDERANCFSIAGKTLAIKGDVLKAVFARDTVFE